MGRNFDSRKTWEWALSHSRGDHEEIIKINTENRHTNVLIKQTTSKILDLEIDIKQRNTWIERNSPENVLYTSFKLGEERWSKEMSALKALLVNQSLVFAKRGKEVECLEACIKERGELQQTKECSRIGCVRPLISASMQRLEMSETCLLWLLKHHQNLCEVYSAQLCRRFRFEPGDTNMISEMWKSITRDVEYSSGRQVWSITNSAVSVHYDGPVARLSLPVQAVKDIQRELLPWKLIMLENKPPAFVAILKSVGDLDLGEGELRLGERKTRSSKRRKISDL